MPSAASLRRFLRNLLDRELTSVEARDPSKQMKATMFVLREAIEGLYALDQGEVRPIFKKASTTTRGAYPATLQHCRRQAVTYVKILNQKCGLKVHKAKEQVAEAYGITIDNLDIWRKNLKPLVPPSLKLGSKVIVSSPEMIEFPVSKDGILKELKEWGRKYRDARKMKKGSKP